MSTGGELPENIGFKSDGNLDTDAITTPLVSVRDECSESDIGGFISDRNLDMDAIAKTPAEEANELSRTVLSQSRAKLQQYNNHK